MKRFLPKHFVLHGVGIVIAVLILWRFSILAERSERSVHWHQPVSSGHGASVWRATTSTAPGAVEEVERLVLELTNRQRRRRGLAPLDDDIVLSEVARRHSSAMLRRGFFDHVTPEGVTAAERVAAGHRSLVGVTGENIWSGSDYRTEAPAKLARTILDDWMESPGHRKNILSSTYTHLGVGIAVGSGEIRATQSFAGVRAYLEVPLPDRVRPGDSLDLDAATYGDNLAPAELFSFTCGDDGGEPRPVTDARVPSITGKYTLCLYFPETSDGGYRVYFGPAIVVE